MNINEKITCPHCGTDLNNKITSLSFWFMTDMHTFIRPKGNDIYEIRDSLIEIAVHNPYGMVCPVIILDSNGKEIKRSFECGHVDNKGNVNLSKWWAEIKEYKNIKIEQS